MFTDSSPSVHEELPQWSSVPAAAPAGVQPLGMMGGGLWALPTLSKDIPVAIAGDPAMECYMAQFALAASAAGLPITAATFTTLTGVVAGQIQSALPADSLLDASVVLGITRGSALPPLDDPFEPNAPVFFMEVVPGGQRMASIDIAPAVKGLNSLLPSLGWWLSNVLNDVHSAWLATYDPLRGVDIAGYVWGMWEWDDKAYLEEQGLDEDEQFHGLLPSQVLAGLGPNELTRTTRGLTLPNQRAIKALLNGPLAERERNLITQVEALRKSLATLTKLRRSARMECEYTGGDHFGALAWVYWENQDTLIEAVEAFENHAMQGEAECITCRYAVAAADQARWPAFIQLIKAVFRALRDLDAVLKTCDLWE